MLRSAAIDDLIAALAARGYTVIGPTVRDGAILYEEVSSAAELPAGITDEQEGGTYRLHERGDEALFGFNNGPNSWKHHLFPPNLTLWKARRAEDGADLLRGAVARSGRATRSSASAPATWRAIGVQDKVFIGDSYTDADYEAPPPRRLHRRDQLLEGREHLLLRLDGDRAAGEVRLRPGADRAARGRSTASWWRRDRERGEEILAEIGATRGRRRRTTEAAAAVSEECASQMGRELDTDGIKELLYRNMEHPRWDEVSERCLTCGNCTLVCPTCFCHTVEDVSDLAGEEAERVRQWDSCFNLDHSYIHGGSVRQLLALALPAVDDPQARDLDRPVRHLGLRRLRALHHLVPGGDRHHRGGGGDPRHRPRPIAWR